MTNPLTALRPKVYGRTQRPTPKVEPISKFRHVGDAGGVRVFERDGEECSFGGWSSSRDPSGFAMAADEVLVSEPTTLTDADGRALEVGRRFALMTVLPSGTFERLRGEVLIGSYADPRWKGPGCPPACTLPRA